MGQLILDDKAVSEFTMADTMVLGKTLVGLLQNGKDVNLTTKKNGAVKITSTKPHVEKLSGSNEYYYR